MARRTKILAKGTAETRICLRSANFLTLTNPLSTQKDHDHMHLSKVSTALLPLVSLELNSIPLSRSRSKIVTNTNQVACPVPRHCWPVGRRGRGLTYQLEAVVVHGCRHASSGEEILSLHRPTLQDLSFHVCDAGHGCNPTVY